MKTDKKIEQGKYPKAPVMFFADCQPAMDKVWQQRCELLEACKLALSSQFNQTIDPKAKAEAWTKIQQAIFKTESEG